MMKDATLSKWSEQCVQLMRFKRELNSGTEFLEHERILTKWHDTTLMKIRALMHDGRNVKRILREQEYGDGYKTRYIVTEAFEVDTKTPKKIQTEFVSHDGAVAFARGIKIAEGADMVYINKVRTPV